MTEIPTGLYTHYKGKPYEVVGIAHHSETREVLVVYKMLYASDFPEGTLWVRPLVMFKEQVNVDGNMVPRFKYIGPA